MLKMSNEVQVMIKQNYKFSKQLTPENERIFTDIVCYLRTSDIDELQAEEAIQQILDMFLSAQHRGEAISDVIGSDYKEFCNEIIHSSSKQRFSSKVLTFLELLLFCMVLMWVIDLAFAILPQIIKNKQINLEYTVTLGFLARVFTVLAIAYALINYIGRNSFQLAKKSRKKFFIFGCLFGLFILLPAFISYLLKDFVLFTTELHYIGLILIPSYLASRYYNRWRS